MYKQAINYIHTMLSSLKLPLLFEVLGDPLAGAMAALYHLQALLVHIAAGGASLFQQLGDSITSKEINDPLLKPHVNEVLFSSPVPEDGTFIKEMCCGLQFFLAQLACFVYPSPLTYVVRY